MKTTSIILSILLLSSCYTYKAFDPEEYALEISKGNNQNQTTNSNERSRSRADIAELRRERKSPNENAISSSLSATICLVQLVLIQSAMLMQSEICLAIAL